MKTHKRRWTPAGFSVGILKTLTSKKSIQMRSPPRDCTCKGKHFLHIKCMVCKKNALY